MGFFSGITSLFSRNDSALHHDQAAALREQEGMTEDWVDDLPTEQPGSPQQNNVMPQQTQTLLTTATATSTSANIALASTIALTSSLNAHLLPSSATSSVAATASSVIGSLAINTEHAATSHVFHLPSSLENAAPSEVHFSSEKSLSQRISSVFNSCVDSLRRGKNRTVEVISNNKGTVITATAVAVVAVAYCIVFYYVIPYVENNAYKRGYDVAYLKALKDCSESVVVAKSGFWKWWPF
jgi:hypothetical protein